MKGHWQTHDPAQICLKLFKAGQSELASALPYAGSADADLAQASAAGPCTAALISFIQGWQVRILVLLHAAFARLGRLQALKRNFAED